MQNQVFPYILCISLHLFNGAIWNTNDFHFKSQHIYFFFCYLRFCYFYLRNHGLTPDHSDLYLFSSKNFIWTFSWVSGELRLNVKITPLSFISTLMTSVLWICVYIHVCSIYTCVGVHVHTQWRSEDIGHLTLSLSTLLPWDWVSWWTWRSPVILFLIAPQCWGYKCT